MHVHYQRLLSIVFLLSSIHSLHAYSPEYAKTITEDYLNSYGRLTKEEEKSKEEKKQTWLEWLKGPRFKPEIPVREERHYQDFLNKAHPPTVIDSKQSAIDLQSVKKLEVVLGGEQQSQTLVNHLSHTVGPDGTMIPLCHTRNGQKAFATMLTQPASNLADVQKNPRIIKAFLAHGRLMKGFGIVTGLMKGVEESFLEFYADEIPENEKLFAEVYLGKWLDSFNQNSVALETNVRARNGLDAIHFASIPFSFWLTSSICHARGIQFTNITHHINRFIDGTITWDELDTIMLAEKRNKAFMHASTPSLLASFGNHGLYDTYEFTKRTPGYIRAWFSLIQHLPDPKARMAAYGFTGLMATTWSYGMYTTAMRVKFQNDTTCFLQGKMIALATYINSIKQLYLMAKNNPAIANNMPELACLECLVKPSSAHSAKFNELISLLDTKTFTGKPSFFSLMGRVLASYKLMKEVKEEFAEVLHVAGKLEALWAMAAKIKAHEESERPYTFVEFVVSDTPYIYAQDFCNPFVPAHIVVPNTLTMSADATGHIILTGPNTGGKSTLIKALWINTLMAQTFGVAYATKFVMTPFYKLSSYLNINDNVSEGVSLFKAEVLRARELRDALVALRKDQFMFIIMDEIFSGTSPDKAQEISKDFITNVAQFSNCLFINATHFPLLTKLEEEGMCKNYRMELIPETLPNGTERMKCTYKLLEGISQISNATQIVEEGGVTW